MTHYLLNLTWRCQNGCSYCWLNTTIRQRASLLEARERPMEDWMRLVRRMKRGDIVDICGGEPLLVPWLIPFLVRLQGVGIQWAITTNMQDDTALHRLLNEEVLAGGIVTASWHGQMGADEFVRRAAMLSRKFGVTANFLSCDLDADAMNGLAEAGVRYHESPYEEPLDLAVPSEVGYCCKGGETHMVIAPDGTYWPCITALRSPRWQEYILGNAIDNLSYQSARAVMNPCYLRCEQAGILKTHPGGADIWHVEARPCT